MAIPYATPRPIARPLSYFVAALVTAAIGLLVHGGWLPLPPVVRDIAGDLLWATMMVWLVSVVLPSWAHWARGALAFAICFTVETSQLVRWQWLLELRAHPLGHLVLGSDFDARDLFAYLAGCCLAVLLEWIISQQPTAPK